MPRNAEIEGDVLLRPSDPSTARTLWEGEAGSGGVPVHRPASSSPPGDTRWPIRTLSKLPSPTPFPSHRPHGNLGKRGEASEESSPENNRARVAAAAAAAGGW